jgi:3-dehydroshikimate dehydratase
MFRSGLVSITFRKLEPKEIVDLVARAGLDAIEWGGDIHVPHGQLETARTVRGTTEKSGLTISSYGSYYRVGESEKEGLSFKSVLDTAIELGAPLVRVWAGKRSSDKADEEYFDAVVRESRRIADMAGDAGLSIAYEFHGGTLTDTNASARVLLENVNHDRALAYWQPPRDSTLDYCLDGIEAMLPWLSVIHVFHWVGADRFLLEEGRETWKTFLSKIRESGRDHFALLEFVQDHDPDNFLKDAETLKQLLAEANTTV